MIANLHTLDTARRYCDRVIGMRDGRIVDGTPAQLTTGVARDIYGAGADFSKPPPPPKSKHWTGPKSTPEPVHPPRAAREFSSHGDR